MGRRLDLFNIFMDNPGLGPQAYRDYYDNVYYWLLKALDYISVKSFCINEKRNIIQRRQQDQEPPTRRQTLF